MLRNRLRMGLGLALCAGLTACVTVSLEKRPWVELKTPHYDIVSSLGEQKTVQLGRDLERFRMANEQVLGRRIPAPPIRTRVYAFDDRSIGRPFDLRGEPGYLLSRLRGDILVLRLGDGWNDATTKLKLDYAQRLFRGAGALDLPIWVDEGLAQFASTLQIHGDRADLGIVRQDHVRLLRKNLWVPIDRVLTAYDLEGWSGTEREELEAESWALVHCLSIARRSELPGEALAHYRSLLDEGYSLSDAAKKLFEGSPSREVHRYVSGREFDSISVRLPALPPDSDANVRALSRGEALGQLGSLSLALGRTKQAKRYFELAAAAGFEPAAVDAGLGVALALENDWVGAEARFLDALALRPEDPFIHLSHGNALRVHAEASLDAEERTRLVERARAQYRRSLELDGAIPEAHFMLADTDRIEARNALRGIEDAKAASALLPASLEIPLLLARLELAAGNRTLARADAVEVLSRARRRETLDSARNLLEAIDAPQSRNERGS